MRRFCGLLVPMVLAACAALDPAADQAVKVDRMLNEALNVSRAPTAEQKAALARAQRDYARNPGDASRLRLALLLATLPAPLRDDAKAVDLLEPLADANAPGFGRFAALLAAQATERQRLGRELERLSRERARVEREHEQSDKERDKREEALRQQIEALRAIERGILEREDRLRRRTR